MDISCIQVVDYILGLVDCNQSQASRMLLLVRHLTEFNFNIASYTLKPIVVTY